MMIQADVEAALKGAGFEPLVASCGGSALAMLEAKYAHIHGLVTDVKLGDGADGWSVARRARELLPSLPVVYASGGTKREWFSRGVPLSVMIEKPFVPTQIIVAMSLLLNEPLPAQIG